MLEMKIGRIIFYCITRAKKCFCTKNTSLWSPKNKNIFSETTLSIRTEHKFVRQYVAVFLWKKMIISVSHEDLYFCLEAGIRISITTTNGDFEKKCWRENLMLSRRIVVGFCTTAGECTLTKFNIFSLKFPIKLLWS